MRLTTLEDVFDPIPGYPATGDEQASPCGCSGDKTARAASRSADSRSADSRSADSGSAFGSTNDGMNNSTRVTVNVGNNTDGNGTDTSGRTGQGVSPVRQSSSHRRGRDEREQPSRMSSPVLRGGDQQRPIVIVRQPYPVIVDRVKEKVKTVFRNIVRPIERRIVQTRQQPILLPQERRVIQTEQQPILLPQERRVIQTEQQPILLPQERRIVQIQQQPVILPKTEVVEKTRYVKPYQPPVPMRVQGNKWDKQTIQYRSLY